MRAWRAATSPAVASAGGTGSAETGRIEPNIAIASRRSTRTGGRGLAPDEPVRYRRVRLACGVHVLSEADNWYVPGRLTPAMNAALDETDAPFGRVVRPLEPTRRNVALRPLRDPDAPPPGPDDPLFEIDAVLATGAGLPFCEVAETYLGAVLGRGL